MLLAAPNATVRRLNTWVGLASLRASASNTAGTDPPRFIGVALQKVRRAPMVATRVPSLTPPPPSKKMTRTTPAVQAAFVPGAGGVRGGWSGDT